MPYFPLQRLVEQHLHIRLVADPLLTGQLPCAIDIVDWYTDRDVPRFTAFSHQAFRSASANRPVSHRLPKFILNRVAIFIPPVGFFLFGPEFRSQWWIRFFSRHTQNLCGGSIIAT
jgi:hypothetical protein